MSSKQERDGAGHRRVRRALRWVALTVAVLVAATAAYGAWVYVSLSHGITRSRALAHAKVHRSVHGDVNILLMGLDTRLDENGHRLSPRLYAALHSGDQSSGGENANVLMVLHLPGNGAPAVAVSIPRDDYTAFPGCPDGECQGKIKEAYGLAFDAASRALARSGSRVSGARREQLLRDAGRAEEIATVSQFLGGVPIDHFVEVTMVAFYRVAQVVQPVTVCVAEDTTDSYSGASFHKGLQRLDAIQAVEFVRQRRDTARPWLDFTDLDRERRQQAFISSLAYELRQTSTFVDPTRLTSLVDIAKTNMAVDTRLDLLSFAQDAQRLAGGAITFYTLPVARFGRTSYGADVNFVNLPALRATVRELFSDRPLVLPSPTTAASPTTPTSTASPGPSGKPTVAPLPVVPLTGTTQPAVTQLTALQGGGIRCVK